MSEVDEMSNMIWELVEPFFQGGLILIGIIGIIAIILALILSKRK